MLAWIECLMAHSSDFAPLQPTARLCSLADLFRCFTQFLPWVPGIFFLVCGWILRCRPKADVNSGETVTQPETAQEAVNKSRFLERSRHFLSIHVSMLHR